MLVIEIFDPQNPDHYMRLEEAGLDFHEFMVEFHMFLAGLAEKEKKTEIKKLKKRVARQRRILGGLKEK